MKKYLLSTVFVVSLVLTSCSNPELEEAKKNLEIAKASRDHPEIILYAERVLEFDPKNVAATSALKDSSRIFEEAKKNLEIAKANRNHPEIMIYADKLLELDSDDITAVAALRDSARIYEYLMKTLEILSKADANFDRISNSIYNIGFDTDDIDDTFVVDNPDVIDFIERTYNENVKLFVDAQYLSPPTDAYYPKLYEDSKIDEDEEKTGIMLMSKYLGEETKVINKKLVLNTIKFVRDIKFTPYAIETLREQANYLVEAKSLLKKAERLDNRFMGIIELEETIDKKAAILTSAFSYQVLNILQNDLSDAAEYFDELRGQMRENLAKYGPGTMPAGWPTMSVSEAYSISRGQMMLKDGSFSKLATFKRSSNSLSVIQSIYKDLEDEFEIDSVEPGIKTCKSMMRAFELSTEAEGSLVNWEREMTKAMSSVNQNLTDFIQELIPLEKIAKFTSDIDETTKEIVSDQVREIYQKRIDII